MADLPPRIDLAVSDYVVAKLRWQWARERVRRPPHPSHPNRPGTVDTTAPDHVHHDQELKRTAAQLHRAGVRYLGGLRREDNQEIWPDVLRGMRLARLRLRHGDVAAQRCQCSDPGCGRELP